MTQAVAGSDRELSRNPATLIERCQRETRRAIARVDLLRGRGDHRGARREQDRLLSSFGGRLAALAAVNRRLPVAHRRPPDELITGASTLDLYSPSMRPAAVRPMEKSTGGHRMIWSFQFEDKARQVLAKWALEPFLEVASSQFTLRGGRDAACQAALSAMASGFKWVVLTDVQDCFGSFDADKLADTLPLPRRVTEHVILSRGYQVAQCSVQGDILQHGGMVRASRRGIPQGSAASSHVQEHELSVLAAAVPETARTVVFADNVIVFTRTRGEAFQVEQLLSAAARQHRVGPLPLKPFCTKPTSERFNFLGYTIRRGRRGRTLVEPHALNLARMEAQLAELYRGEEEQERARQRLIGWASAFHLWSFSVPWLEQALWLINPTSARPRRTRFFHLTMD